MLARPATDAGAGGGGRASADSLELMQGMLMAQSQTLAKFEKKMDERTSTTESMLMQAAMSSAKQSSESSEWQCERYSLGSGANK